jgi:hypothetical protein
MISYTASSPWRDQPKEREDPSTIPPDTASNFDERLQGERQTVQRLLQELKKDEILAFAEQIMVSALDSLDRDEVTLLYDVVASWLATAEELISSRHRMDEIVQAREIGRRRFGTKPSVPD